MVSLKACFPASLLQVLWDILKISKILCFLLKPLCDQRDFKYRYLYYLVPVLNTSMRALLQVCKTTKNRVNSQVPVSKQQNSNMNKQHDWVRAHRNVLVFLGARDPAVLLLLSGR